MMGEDLTGPPVLKVQSRESELGNVALLTPWRAASPRNMDHSKAPGTAARTLDGEARRHAIDHAKMGQAAFTDNTEINFERATLANK